VHPARLKRRRRHRARHGDPSFRQLIESGDIEGRLTIAYFRIVAFGTTGTMLTPAADDVIE
jgi:hypothetical protein